MEQIKVLETSGCDLDPLQQGDKKSQFLDSEWAARKLDPDILTMTMKGFHVGEPQFQIGYPAICPEFLAFEQLELGAIRPRSPSAINKIVSEINIALMINPDLRNDKGHTRKRPNASRDPSLCLFLFNISSMFVSPFPR